MKNFLLLVSIALIIGGAQGVYTFYKNPVPTVYNLDEICSDNIPDKEWIILKNCDINLLDAVYIESALSPGMAKELFIPLRSPNCDSVVVLLAIKDKNVVNVFNLINKQTDPDKAANFIEKYKSTVYQSNREIPGIVQFGIELKSKERRKLAYSSKLLVDDFIILDFNKKPRKTMYYILFALGIFFLLLFLMARKRAIQEQQTE